LKKFDISRALLIVTFVMGIIAVDMVLLFKRKGWF